MVIGIITVINSIFWLFKRFIKIKNYNIDSKRFDFDKANIILGMMLILIMAIIAYSLDNLFFRTTIGEFFDSSNNFQVLTIKIHYLVIVNIILFSDWKSIRTTEEEIQYSKLSFREIMKWLIIFSVVFFPIFIHLLLLGLRDGFENMLMLLIILSIFLIYAILVLIVLKYEKKNIAEVI